jgi:serine phosphatase RsbU (regulator of sigma subunit)
MLADELFNPAHPTLTGGDVPDADEAGNEPEETTKTDIRGLNREEIVEKMTGHLKRLIEEKKKIETEIEPFLDAQIQLSPKVQERLDRLRERLAQTEKRIKAAESLIADAKEVR